MDNIIRVLALLLVSVITVMSAGVQPADTASLLADREYKGKAVELLRDRGISIPGLLRRAVNLGLVRCADNACAYGDKCSV